MSDRCYHRCNACRHVHQGAELHYTCSRCACNSHESSPHLSRVVDDARSAPVGQERLP